MENNWKKNIILFLTSQTMSLFGTMLVQYAILWHIVLKTKSGIMMTIYILVGVLPTFFTSMFGGVWADKYNKKNLINISDGSIAVASLAIALSLSAGMDSIIMLMIAAFVRALGQGVQQPAVASLIPFIVPEDKLLRINGINASIQSGIFIISPMAAASLMAFAPLETLFLIDVVTASIAIAILCFLVKAPNVNRTDEHSETSHFKDLINGLRYIKSQKYLLYLIIMFAIFTVFMSPVGILSPLQVTRNFGTELWKLSAIEIVFAGGSILGGVLIGSFCFRNKIYAIGTASVVIGVMTLLLGVWTNFIPYLVCMGIAGLTVPYFNAPSMTLLQEKVAPDYLGRVMSVFTMLSSVAMPFAMLFFGPLADVISIDYMMIGSGAAMVFLGILYFLSRTLRETGK